MSVRLADLDLARFADVGVSAAEAAEHLRRLGEFAAGIRRNEAAGLILPSDNVHTRYVERRLSRNCRNCGAPPELVCSYCGTRLYA